MSKGITLRECARKRLLCYVHMVASTDYLPERGEARYKRQLKRSQAEQTSFRNRLIKAKGATELRTKRYAGTGIRPVESAGEESRSDSKGLVQASESTVP